ncbi:Uncharacterized membrane protein YGL010W [Lutibacter oricola]|uniref:Uncharacterized membrane protein YGL010W n=1 Tax=Lutibacter oricola TaxID=762486 RepID=A0A1H2WF57_9FLAO|nr:Mpo1-like protein [Lutibacter oricola]SDW79157.1 Uncharacterized membrane protein YGL010W [Lutibacter oricola]
MKTMHQWFSEYSISHQNKTNKKIHYICVPAIFFSIVGLLISIPSTFIGKITNLNMPIIENWAVVVAFFLLIFYLRLSFKVFLKMLIFTILCIVGNYYLGLVTPIFYTSLLIFIIAWIGQFYGHKLEGAKPSFLKDLQFLLIGPAWVFDNIFKF